MNFRSLPWKKILWISGGVCAALFLAIFLFVWSLIASAPEITPDAVSPAASATYICDQNGTYLRKLTMSTSNRDIVSLDTIPTTLQQAVIAIEDSRFYEHNGIDLHGIVRAFWKGITHGSFSEGASTITQQLIKNNIFTEWTQENSFSDRLRRKIQEQYLALRLEKQASKDEILEDYLNTINFGSGCYGAQAASRRYFGKNVSDLTLSEAAVLAAIPQNPSGYNPIRHPEANQRRQTIILNYMLEQGFITEQELAAAQADDVYARIQAFDASYASDTAYTYYEDALIKQVTDTLIAEFQCSTDEAYQAIYSGGLRIYSAQDLQLQQICDEEFANPANFPADVTVDPLGTLTDNFSDTAVSLPQPQASLVLIDQQTGSVKAVVGGRGPKTASLTLNRATETKRQPGSTFKILTAYAPALESYGKTLATLYDNEPYQYENGVSVSNWDITDYSGPETIREAIIRSINVIAVKCLTEITPQAGFDFARRFGISTLHESYETASGTASDIIQPLALGGITEGVTNLELCNAYAAVANGGIYHTPKFFTRIEDRNGAVIFDASAPSTAPNEPLPNETVLISENGLPSDNTRILSESTAFLLTSAMQAVVSSPSGTAYGAVSAAGQTVAGKTGTTSNYKDIWFVGYTPYYTCCVWGGYDNNQNLPAGSRAYSKTIWTAVMSRIHADLPISGFTPPDSVTAVTLCQTSHLPARDDACPDTYLEYFAKGTQPQEICPLHEPIPETEPIVIFPDLLDQLLPETESESETETDSEPISDPESESNFIFDSESEADSDSAPGSDTDFSISSEKTAESASHGSSLDDLLDRLAAELSTFP